MEAWSVRDLVEESRRLREEARTLIAKARKASEECEQLLLEAPEHCQKDRQGGEGSE